MSHRVVQGIRLIWRSCIVLNLNFDLWLLAALHPGSFDDLGWFHPGSFDDLGWFWKNE